MFNNTCIDCGKPIGKTSKRCCSCANRASWANPECRANHVAAIASPEYKQKLSQTMKEICANPEWRRRMSEAGKAYWADPENKAYRVMIQRSAGTRRKKSEGTASAWARGDYDNRDRSFYNKEFSRSRRGSGNPMYGRSLKDIMDPEAYATMRRRQAKSLRDRALLLREGMSNEPYPLEFNNVFKKMIRERDKYKCAVCRLPGKDVHHIDYAKGNTVPENCITLCRSCHSTTSHNREYWQKELSNLIRLRQVVRELTGLGATARVAWGSPSPILEE